MSEKSKGIVIIVCGGRAYDDSDAAFDALDRFHAAKPVSLVVQGGAPGADLLAKTWARSRGLPCQEERADWNKHGRKAGPIRNQHMLKTWRPQAVVAFPGGAGTAHMKRIAKEAGVPVFTPRLPATPVQTSVG